MRIVGINTEKPETKFDYLNKPLIIEDILPRCDYFKQWNLLPNSNLDFNFLPQGQRFFSSYTNNGFSINDNGVIEPFLPVGYYNYVGVLLFREELDSLSISRYAGGRFLTSYDATPTITEVKQNIAAGRTDPLNCIWPIVENDEGQRFYLYPGPANDC